MFRLVSRVFPHGASKRLFHGTSMRCHGGGSHDPNAPVVALKFRLKDGTIRVVDAQVGTSILDVAHRYDIDLEGACESSLACSTCHVILEDDKYDSLPEPSEEEEDMLDMAFGLTATSRLGCQVMVTEDLVNAIVTLPSATRNFYVDGHFHVFMISLSSSNSMDSIDDSVAFPLTEIPIRRGKLPLPSIQWEVIAKELQNQVKKSLSESYQSMLALESEFLIRLQADGVVSGFKVDPALVCHLELHQVRITQSLQKVVASTIQENDVFINDFIRTLRSDYDMQRGSIMEEIRAHKQTADESLKRSRLVLAKEVERFTGLEKCLRKDEIRVLEEQHRERIAAMRDEMDAKEKEHIQVLLRQKSAFHDIERFNKHLQNALDGANAEIEKMKKIDHQRVTNNTAVNTISESYVHSLRQAVSTANDRAEGLRLEVERCQKEFETCKNHCFVADETIIKLQLEMKEVRTLLAESAHELIAVKELQDTTAKELAETLVEVSDLTMKAEKLETQLTGQTDLVATSDVCITDLNQQVQNIQRHLASILKERTDEQMRWKNELERFENERSRDANCIQMLRNQLNVLGYDKATLEVFHTPTGQSTSSTTRKQEAPSPAKTTRARSKASRPTEYDTLVQILQREKIPLEEEKAKRLYELETALRASVTSQLTYEFKKNFSKQLNLRMQQERFYLLNQIDSIVSMALIEERAAKNLLSKQAKAVGRRNSIRHVREAVIPMRRLKAILTQAFESMGVAEWGGEDVASLKQQLEFLQADVAAHDAIVAELEGTIEIQLLSLAELELSQKERDMLLMELTNKYNQATDTIATLKSKYEVRHDEQEDNINERQTAGPLQVQGYLPQMETRRLPSSLGLNKHTTTKPVARPNSAIHTPTLMSKEVKKRPATSRSNVVRHNNNQVEIRKPLEHVRSVMKWELFNEKKETSPTEDVHITNEWVGEAGMKTILDRRRNRK